MTTKSLQSKIHQQALLTVFAVGVVTISSAIVFSSVKAEVSRAAVGDALIKSSLSQVDSLLPTFLLPEEKAGTDLLLNRMKESDALDEAIIVHSQSDMPAIYKSCRFTNQSNICVSSDNKRVASITPIVDGDHNFGYLLKGKQAPAFWDKDQMAFVVFAITIAFSLIAILLFFGITHVTSTEVPHSLNALVLWLDEWISKKESSDRPNFEFKEFQDLAEKIAIVIQERQKERDQVRIFALASQVAHDIRSPLAALSTLEKELNVFDEEKRLMIRGAVNRIKDIANNLLSQNQIFLKDRESIFSVDAEDEPVSTQLLSSLIEPLITEKRMQFRARIGIDVDGIVDAGSYGVFSNIQPNKFKRVLSNLLNNAVEAMESSGQVTVTISARNQEIELMVQDNAKGIEPNILAKLGQRGVTFGKEGGSGLGLFYAKDLVESWGGRIKIISEVGKGTSVTLTLQQAAAPDWFVSVLKLNPGTSLVVLDDDTSIHRIWQGRADSICAGTNRINVVHLSTPEQFRMWISENLAASKRAKYLCDYELLGYGDTGLSLIQEFELGDQSVLVTSRFEEKQILESCRRLKVGVIPKVMSAFVPISITEQKLCPDAILIDDDDLIRMLWQGTAAQQGLELLYFNTAEAFFESASQINRLTPVYVDSNLGKGRRGENVSKEIFDLGFKTVYLATGYDPSSFSPMPWVTGIIGKTPPWA